MTAHCNNHAALLYDCGCSYYCARWDSAPYSAWLTVSHTIVYLSKQLGSVRKLVLDVFVYSSLPQGAILLKSKDFRIYHIL